MRLFRLIGANNLEYRSILTDAGLIGDEGRFLINVLLTLFVFLPTILLLRFRTRLTPLTTLFSIPAAMLLFSVIMRPASSEITPEYVMLIESSLVHWGPLFCGLLVYCYYLHHCTKPLHSDDTKVLG